MSATYIFGSADRHYCTGCQHGRKSLLIRNEPPFDVLGTWKCPVCKATVG